MTEPGMPKKTISPAKLRIGFVPLALPGKQVQFLNSLVEKQAGMKQIVKVAWARRSKMLAPYEGLELDRDSVGVTLNALALPDGRFLNYAPGYQVTGFNATKDRVFLGRQEGLWAIGLLYKPRTKKKDKKDKRKQKFHEKLYDEAGLFVTESTGHKVWSGGLPSLGKRR